MRMRHDRHGTQEAIGLSLVSWRIIVSSVSFELHLRGSRCWCCKLMRRGVTQQVIWAALFALAVLVREGSTPHSPALRAIAACGMLPILNACMSDYKVQLILPAWDRHCLRSTGGELAQTQDRRGE